MSSNDSEKPAEAKNASKEPKEKPAKEKAARVHVQNAHRRLNFLHQVALQLSSESTSTNDGYAKLSRSLGRHFRGVLDTETVKVDPQIMRTFCKSCKQVLLAKSQRFELKLIQKKLMQRRCLLCGHEKNYELNPDYLSRNERYLRETGQ